MARTSRPFPGAPNPSDDSIILGEVLSSRDEPISSEGNKQTRRERRHAQRERERMERAERSAREETARQQAQKDNPKREKLSDKVFDNTFMDSLKDEVAARLTDKAKREKITAERAKAREGASPLQRLQMDVFDAGTDFAETLGRTDLFGADTREVENQLTLQQRQYVGLMGLACINSLRDGLSPETVVRTVSMATAMYALSPAFRQSTDRVRENALDSLDRLVSTRIEKTQEQAKNPDVSASRRKRYEDRADLLRTRYGALRKFTSFEKRPAYDATSASMVAMAIHEQTYRKVREPGADTDAIVARAAHLYETLYSQARLDGVAGEDIDRMTRVLTTKLVKGDPRHCAMFDELAQGVYRPGKPRTARPGSSETSMPVVSDAFSNLDGQEINRGVFGIRDVMTSDEHVDAISQAMIKDLARGTQRTGADTMLMYALGPEYLTTMTTISDKDRPTLNAMISMKQAMHDDGFDESEAEVVYETAFAVALREIEAEHPARANAWRQVYGDRWKETFMRINEDPSRISTIWEHADDDRVRTDRPDGERPRTSQNRADSDSRDEQEEEEERQEQERADDHMRQTTNINRTINDVDDGLTMESVEDPTPFLGGSGGSDIPKLRPSDSTPDGPEL